MRGARIDYIERLAELAAQKRSVWHHGWGVKPAVVIMNMQCSLVWKCITMGTLYEWIPETRRGYPPYVGGEATAHRGVRK